MEFTFLVTLIASLLSNAMTLNISQQCSSKYDWCVDRISFMKNFYDLGEMCVTLRYASAVYCVQSRAGGCSAREFVDMKVSQLSVFSNGIVSLLETAFLLSYY